MNITYEMQHFTTLQIIVYKSFKTLRHRNNRHRMRAPIFSQSKICLHKMAHSKGHFYSVQTPVARNFARSRNFYMRSELGISKLVDVYFEDLKLSQRIC